MADYTGMTYKEILEKAEIIAHENDANLDRRKSAAFIDEAILEVAKDIMVASELLSQTWPTGSPPTITVSTSGVLNMIELYGDSQPIYKIPYDQFRQQFLGTESLKPSGDFNYYWSYLGNTIYIEPNVTAFTNLIIQHAPLNTKYEQDGSTDSSEPQIPFEYRMLIAYKIPAMIYGSGFESIYRDKLRKAFKFKNQKHATGRVRFYDPFSGDIPTRNSSGWRGKISNDS